MVEVIPFEVAVDILRHNSAWSDVDTALDSFRTCHAHAARDPRRAPYYEWLLATGAKIKIGPAHPGERKLRLVLAGYAADGSDITTLKRGGM